MATQHTPASGPLTYFVGNSDGRGLIRIETDLRAPVAGIHICSMPRGAQSEANAEEMVRRWNGYDEQAQRADDNFASYERVKEALSEKVNSHDALVAALRGLSDMYAKTWDRVDGALVLMPDNIELFERAHEAARAALAGVGK